MKICVVVPTYNEAQNLPDLVRRLFDEDIPGLEILVVDDASPDGTGDLADSLAQQHPGQFHVLHRKGKLGLASAYRDGFREALRLGATVIAQIDADLSHPPEHVVKLIAPILEGKADVVIASRYVSGGSADPDWPLHRKALSKGGNIYARLVTGMPINDSTSGFRCFRSEVLEKDGLIDRPKCRGFGFQAEMAYHCWREGFRIQEVPYVFHDREKGSSKISMNIVVEALVRLPQLRLSRKYSSNRVP